MKKIVLFLIAAILLSSATASSASVRFSYGAETTDRLTVDEDYRFNTYGNPIVGDRYSLALTARNSETTTCDHSFSTEDREINTGTSILYSRDTSQRMGGLYLEEISGASSIIEEDEEDTTFVGCSDSTIGFSADVDSLRFLSAGWIKDGSQTRDIDTGGGGDFDAGLDFTSSEGEGQTDGEGGCAGNCDEYVLRSTERISSYVGGRSGDFNFIARYDVTPPWA